MPVDILLLLHPRACKVGIDSSHRHPLRSIIFANLHPPGLIYGSIRERVMESYENIIKYGINLNNASIILFPHRPVSSTDLPELQVNTFRWVANRSQLVRVQIQRHMERERCVRTSLPLWQISQIRGWQAQPYSNTEQTFHTIKFPFWIPKS